MSVLDAVRQVAERVMQTVEQATQQATASAPTSPVSVDSQRAAQASAVTTSFGGSQAEQPGMFFFGGGLPATAPAAAPTTETVERVPDDETGQSGIFTDPEDQGVRYDEVDPVSIDQDENATPEQVASHIKNHPPSSYEPHTAYYEYLGALHAHQGDAEWLADFYAALGPEQSAELIAQAVDPLTHGLPGGAGAGDPEMAARQLESIRNSLETLRESGQLTEAGLATLLDAFPNNPQLQQYLATEVFSAASTELKEMFINYAARQDGDTWNAAGLHVLNSLAPYEQEQILTGLGGDLDEFIAGAMAGEQEIYSFADSVRLGINIGMADDLLDKVTFGGVEELLETANNITVYYHAQVALPDFDPELQTDIFAAVVKGLDNPETFESFRDSAGFKEELGDLFMRNGAAILAEQAPDGAFTDAAFLEGMTKFFELTLFTDNPGENRMELMESVIDVMSAVGDAAIAPPLSQAEYEELHNGWSQQDHVEVMGGLQAMILQAASNQKSYIENQMLQDAQQRQALVGFVVGMAFSFLPGASKVFGTIAEEGASFLQQIPDKIVGYTYDQAKSQINQAAQEGLLALLESTSEDDTLTSINAFLDGFKDTIVATNSALPNGEEGELNLRTAFQSAFAFYGDLVRFP